MMKAIFAVLALLAVQASAGKGVFQATDKNFKSDVLNGGKNAFVKFLAPWCGHCKSMKADWDKLGAKYKDSDAVMIVDADCTGPAQSTCQSQGVKGYPTIKYYMGGKAKDYQQGRDFNSLFKFTEATLNKAQCDPATGKGCKPIQKKFIEANKDKSKSELKTMQDERKATHKETQAAFKAAEKEFKAKMKEWKSADRKFKMADAILKKLIASAKDGAKEEL